MRNRSMDSELDVVIGIGGPSGAGKTTLARALAERYGVPRASFSDVLHTDAAMCGLEPTRRNLQDLGLRRIELGWPSFVASVTALLGWPPACPAVIEGIRHVGAVRSCAVAAGEIPMLLVFLIADSTTRLRGMGRDLNRVEPIQPSADEHEVESDVAQVASIADLVLYPSRIANWIREIEAAIEATRTGSWRT